MKTEYRVDGMSCAACQSSVERAVKEDVTNIILNLKQVRFKQVVDEFENEKVKVYVADKGGDILEDDGKSLIQRIREQIALQDVSEDSLFVHHILPDYHRVLL